MLTFSAENATELFVQVDEGAITLQGNDRKFIEASLDASHDIGYDDVVFTKDGGRVVLKVNAAADVAIGAPRAISVTLITGDGHIEVNGFDGALDARTDDGHIEAHGRFSLLRLATDDGHIEVEVDAGSRMAAGWSIRTDDGSIEVRLPSDFDADLDASTDDGTVEMDFPLTDARFLEKSVNGKINGGGYPLVVRTDDGFIEIKRREVR